MRIDVKGHKETWSIKSAHARGILIQKMMSKGIVPSTERFTTLKNLLEGEAYVSEKKYDIFNRVAKLDGSIWLDLTNNNHDAIEISEGIWKKKATPKPLFCRYNHHKPLTVEPGSKEAFDRFISLLNLKDNEANHQTRLIMGYIGTLLHPSIPKAVLLPVGTQGSAKSTMLEQIRSLADPSATITLSIPRQSNELERVINHHYCAFFDNIQHLSSSQSDVLCRACTGAGINKRMLFTDDDDYICHYVRAVALNGITPYGFGMDLLDRSIRIELERIPDEKRRELELLRREYAELQPAATGYLLDCFAAALVNRDEVRADMPRLSRMADFIIMGESVSREMGLARGAWYNTYKQATQQQNIDSILNTTLGSAIYHFISNDERFEGTPSELLKELKISAEYLGSNVKASDFPQNANTLSRRLTTMSPGLEAMGIRVIKARGHDRIIKLYFTGEEGLEQTTLSDANASQENNATRDATRRFMGWKK